MSWIIITFKFLKRFFSTRFLLISLVIGKFALPPLQTDNKIWFHRESILKRNFRLYLHRQFFWEMFEGIRWGRLLLLQIYSHFRISRLRESENWRNWRIKHSFRLVLRNLPILKVWLPIRNFTIKQNRFISSNKFFQQTFCFY